MATAYRPSEAISLLRPCFVLPRTRPSAPRRAALSTSRPAPAPSPPLHPPPPPPRRSITLTGDTGQVRWSDLSPGEKAVRTTQQSANLVVVVVGLLATVSLLNSLIYPPTHPLTGWRRLLPLRRRPLPLIQDGPLQSRDQPRPRRRPLPKIARPGS